jgi:hypothetical protein
MVALQPAQCPLNVMTHDASLGWVEGWYEENLGSPLKSAYSGAHPLCRLFSVK